MEAPRYDDRVVEYKDIESTEINPQPVQRSYVNHKDFVHAKAPQGSCMLSNRSDRQRLEGHYHQTATAANGIRFHFAPPCNHRIPTASTTSAGIDNPNCDISLSKLQTSA